MEDSRLPRPSVGSPAARRTETLSVPSWKSPTKCFPHGRSDTVSSPGRRAGRAGALSTGCWSSPLPRLCLGHMVSRTSAAFASWHPALPSACRPHAGRLTPSLQLPGDLEHWPSWATRTGLGMLVRPEPVQGPSALGALLESWVRHSLEPLCGEQGGRRAKVNAGGRQDPDPGLAGPCEWKPSPSQQSDLTFPSSEFSVG